MCYWCCKCIGSSWFIDLCIDWWLISYWLVIGFRFLPDHSLIVDNWYCKYIGSSWFIDVLFDQWLFIDQWLIFDNCLTINLYGQSSYVGETYKSADFSCLYLYDFHGLHSTQNWQGTYDLKICASGCDQGLTWKDFERGSRYVMSGAGLPNVFVQCWANIL